MEPSASASATGVALGTVATAPARAHQKGERSFAEAVRFHVAGDLSNAERAYRRALQHRPDFPEALNNLGAILAQRDNHAAIDMLQRAVRLRPTYGDARRNLGLALAQAGKADDACEALRHAVTHEPQRAGWWIDLGNALMVAQQFGDALSAYDHALRLSPLDAAAHTNRAAALRSLRRHADAVTACERALEIAPTHVDALVNLGTILKEARAFTEARAAMEQAVALAPRAVAPKTNLAVLLMEMNQHAAARVLGEELVAHHPRDPNGWNVLGNVAFEDGDFDKAAVAHREAIACDPNDRNAPWNLAVLALMQGDLGRGFELFEARKRLVSVLFTPRAFEQPEWGGSPLHGRTLLLHAEQGAGDVIHFLRYAAEVKRRGAGRVIVECQADLAELAGSVEGVDEVIAIGTPLPPFDAHAYIMSLPLLCGTTLETIPANVPYIRAPQRGIRDVVRAMGRGVRVGIAWAGNPSHQRDAVRSMSLGTLAPMLDVEGATFFSLQKGCAPGTLSEQNNVVDLAPHLASFSDLAAAIDEMDVVVTVDTSVAHIAGALGKPVWVLLSFVPDWRWMREREDSPWYPTMRLLRQRRHDDWSGPVAEATRGLRALAGSPHVRSQPTPIAIHRPTVTINWQVGLTSGWGTYGLNLAMAMARSPRAEPVLAIPPVTDGLTPIAAQAIRSLRVGVTARSREVVSLVGLGNGLSSDDRFAANPRSRRVGVVFFEDTALDASAIGRAQSYDRIIAGSAWNTELLRALGVERVHCVLQGVDHSIFHPAPRSGALADRFVIFSGGKLEFRKGQDIVIEAFRRFRARHAEALLVTAWHNHWPQTMAGIDATGYVHGCPVVHDGQLCVSEWLVANGLPSDSFIDVGALPQSAMAQTIREADVAVFPNRCEGGTNLVAMETMACAIPTVLSANTGHLNLIGRDTCYPLESQAPVTARQPMYRGTDCWGESDPDELVETLERVYASRAEATDRALNGALLMSELGWKTQADALLTAADL